MVVGKIEYGTWKDGSSIYKDTKGYYIVAYDSVKDKLYKQHIKGWKPKEDAPQLCLIKKKWMTCKKGKKVKKSKTRKTKKQ
jgi:hypothetical protein